MVLVLIIIKNYSAKVLLVVRCLLILSLTLGAVAKADFRGFVLLIEGFEMSLIRVGCSQTHLLTVEIEHLGLVAAFSVGQLGWKS